MSAFLPLLGDKRTSNAPNPGAPVYEYATRTFRNLSVRESTSFEAPRGSTDSKTPTIYQLHLSLAHSRIVIIALP
jgi:hypothetical protein